MATNISKKRNHHLNGLSQALALLVALVLTLIHSAFYQDTSQTQGVTKPRGGVTTDARLGLQLDGNFNENTGISSPVLLNPEFQDTIDNFLKKIIENLFL